MRGAGRSRLSDVPPQLVGIVQAEAKLALEPGERHHDHPPVFEGSVGNEIDNERNGSVKISGLLRPCPWTNRMMVTISPGTR